MVAQSRQKKYAYQEVRDIYFKPGKHVRLKVSPIKRVIGFGKNGNIRPENISLIKVIDDGRLLFYRMTLHLSLSESIQCLCFHF